MLGLQVLSFTADKALMGSFANNLPTRMLAGGVACIVALINLTAVYEVAFDYVVASNWAAAAVISVMVGYFSFLSYLLIGPRRCVPCTARCRAKSVMGVDDFPTAKSVSVPWSLLEPTRSCRWSAWSASHCLPMYSCRSNAASAFCKAYGVFVLYAL